MVGCEPEGEWAGGLAMLYAFVELCVCVSSPYVLLGSSGVRFSLT